MQQFFEEFTWHSSVGINESVTGVKKFFSRLANTKKARDMFVQAGEGDLLVHKTSQALWKISEDGSFIEPVFDTDVLEEDDLENLS